MGVMACGSTQAGLPCATVETKVGLRGGFLNAFFAVKKVV